MRTQSLLIWPPLSTAVCDVDGYLCCLRAGCGIYCAGQALVEWFSVEDMLALGTTELRRSQYMSAIEARKAADHPLRRAQRSIDEQDAAIE